MLVRLGASAALALLASAAAVPAQEWNARLGGFFKGGVGYVDVGQDGNDLGLVREAEVHFRFQMAADNGLVFGSYFELAAEDEKGGADFDEANLFVSGSFGRVEVGEQDGAGDQLTLTPPGCGISCPAEQDGFLFDWYAGEANLGLVNDGADSSDDLKVTYLSPTFRIRTAGASWRLGASWAPTTEDNGRATSLDAAREENFVELGARAGFDLTDMMGADAAIDFSAAYFTADSFEDPSYVFGAEAGYAGFAIGARYSYRNPDGEDEDSVSVGAEYATGPWTFLTNYTTILDSDDPDRQKEDWGVTAEIDYALAPGVLVAGIVEFGDSSGFDDSFAVGTVLSLNY